MHQINIFWLFADSHVVAFILQKLSYNLVVFSFGSNNRYAAGATTAVGGIELTIAARASVAQDSSLNKAEDKLHSAMDKALQYVMAHYAV